jgi:hypothetical protein
MSLQLHNQASHDHNANRQSRIDSMLATQGFKLTQINERVSGWVHPDGRDYWDAYNQISSVEYSLFPEPDNAVTWGCSEGKAMWLSQHLGKSFFIPSEGLKGVAKYKLMDALKAHRKQLELGELEFADPMFDVAAGIGAAMGTVPVVGSVTIIETIDGLLEFLKYAKAVYSI